jgi:hypothetical protein
VAKNCKKPHADSRSEEIIQKKYTEKGHPKNSFFLGTWVDFFIKTIFGIIFF